MCRWFPIRNSKLKEVPNRPKWIYTKRSYMCHCILFLMRNPEFKDVPNRPKWIYTNEAEKSGVQRGPKQAQMDLHKAEPSCVIVDCFCKKSRVQTCPKLAQMDLHKRSSEIQSSKRFQTGPNGSTHNGAIMCRWFLMRNSEFKEVPDRPKRIYTKRSHHVSL